MTWIRMQPGQRDKAEDVLFFFLFFFSAYLVIETCYAILA